MDTRFSSALHMLILISEAETPMTSEQIAGSVGTNATYIRKIAGSLKKAGIIESRQGVRGFTLLIPSERLTLLSIYRAVNGSSCVSLFDLHQNPNDRCIVGKHIKPVLQKEFSSLESVVSQALNGRTLKNIIDMMRNEIDAQGTNMTSGEQK
ncbi:MAG: Rrf2 family transcriptional regulator [Clostridia bacterium]|nr:Rrf2 family transcriptional regulator [Clostridia bacterium]